MAVIQAPPPPPSPFFPDARCAEPCLWDCVGAGVAGASVDGLVAISLPVVPARFRGRQGTVPSISRPLFADPRGSSLTIQA